MSEPAGPLEQWESRVRELEEREGQLVGELQRAREELEGVRVELGESQVCVCVCLCVCVCARACMRASVGACVCVKLRNMYMH